MNQFLFIFKNIFQELIKKRWFNLIIITALSVGLFFPMLFMAKVNYNYRLLSRPLFDETESTAFVDGLTTFKSGEKLDGIFGSIKGVTEFCYSGLIDASIEHGNSSFLSNASGVSENFFKQRTHTIVEGRVPTPEEITNNEHVCVVQRSAGFTDGWVMKTGDKFTLNGEEFTIVGVVIMPAQYGIFLIPYGVTEEMTRENSQVQYMLYAKTTPDNIQYVLDYIEALGFIEVITQSKSGVEHQNFVRNNLIQTMAKSLLRDVTLLGLAVLNFLLIIYGKFVESLYTWGIKIAVGETKVSIFAELFLQNLILTLLSSILPIIAVWAIVPKVIVINMLTDVVWLFAVVLLCILVALVITAVLYIALMRKKTPDMLKVK